MPRNPAPDGRDYRRGLQDMHEATVRSLNELIVNLKSAGLPAADVLINWKLTKLPTVAQVLASEIEVPF